MKPKYIEQDRILDIMCWCCGGGRRYCDERRCTNWHAIKREPGAEVISKAEYDKLLAAAKAMHTWIFLNTADEFEVYDECGLTDEMNALLGSMGRFELKQGADDEHTD